MLDCELVDLPTIGICLQEIRGSTALKWCTFGSIASIAFYNFFGLSVTKRLSGAGRATIDACRTALVWLFSLWIGWEHFHALQVSLHEKQKDLWHSISRAPSTR